MKQEYNNYLLSIKDLSNEEQLNKLKSYRKKLINKFNKKFDDLFEIKHYLDIKDSKYDDLYNDDSVEEMFQDVEFQEYNTIDKCKNIIEELIKILDKLDKEIECCSDLKIKEERIPNKVDMDVVNSLNGYVPLLANKSLSELKKDKKKYCKNDEMYVLLDRTIKYKERKKNNKLLGIFTLGLLFNKKSTNKSNGYESFNYEEQELEEDDFYYDDLD